MSERTETDARNFIPKILKSISLANLNIWVTIIATALATYTGFQAYRVSTQVSLLDNSLKKANLVKELLDILASSNDKKTQKDIALIVLNRTISQDQETRLMTAEIAEQIYRDNNVIARRYAEEYDLNPGNKDKKCRLAEIVAFPASAVAFQVIEENNPGRAQVLLRELGNEVKISQRSSATTKPETSSCLQALSSYYNYFNKVTWLQFNVASRRGDVEAFGKKLNEIGFKVPMTNGKIDTELVPNSGYTWRDDKERVSSVRFYHPSDRPRAERLQRLAQSFFHHDVELDDMSVIKSDEPFGQVEIWIYFAK